MNLSGWHFTFVGWPWWIVLPLAALAAWALLRLQASEVATQPAPVRRALRWLRGAACALIVLCLLEPTLTRTRRVSEPPLVAILVDQSASMDVHDRLMHPSRRLSEAIGLGLIAPGQRPLFTNAVKQAESDTALLTTAPTDSPLARSLKQLGQRSRFDRAIDITRRILQPQLQNRARLRIFGFDTALNPLDLQKPPAIRHGKSTDLETPLATLIRDWSQEHVGAIVLVTDGRQTAGRDPTPLIRALRARGAFTSAILVGDPDPPPDAMVGELSGSSEVFVEESIYLDARFRVLGDSRRAWDLVLTQDGQEIQRKPVRVNGAWQSERFETPARQPGIALFQARLEPRRGDSTDSRLRRTTGQVMLETWRNLPGNDVDAVRRAAAARKPDHTVPLQTLASPENPGDNYGSRIRGWIIPPASGPYTFWISSDDSSELWLSRSGQPKDQSLVASVSGFTTRFQWDKLPTQRSVPITLTAGEPVSFEVWHKEGGGDDHVAVGWQLPDRQMERPIPGHRLALLEATQEPRPSAPTRSTNDWEEASLANNSAEFTVNVNQDPIRVLLADATPRWESRYLSALFERDRRVRLTRRYHSILAGQPQEPFLPRSQGAWDQYDLIVLGDLDPAQLRPDQQQQLADFVARRGGFLVCLAGSRGLPRSFSLSPLLHALPIKVANQAARDSSPVTVELTDAGREHPITQVLSDPALNQRLWPALPPLQWIASSVVAKPGATVLLEAQNPVRTPIVALQRYGAGRVLWMGTSESWRWRDRLGDRVHQTFWLQAMRWGLAGRLRGRDPRLQVGLDRYVLAPGESAELRARASLASGERTGQPIRLKLEKLDPRGAVQTEFTRDVELTLVPDSLDIWHQTLVGLGEGRWRLTVTSPHPDLRALSEIREISIREETGPEGLELSADGPALARLAAAGGHHAGGLEHANAIARDLAAKLQPRTRERIRTLSLWDNYLALLLVLACLSAEWIWRKRRGLP